MSKNETLPAPVMMPEEPTVEDETGSGQWKDYALALRSALAAALEQLEHLSKLATPSQFTIEENRRLREQLRQAEQRAEADRKDAERYRLCQQQGFPVRNQTAHNEDHRWTIQGKWFGATPSICIDAVLAREAK